MSQQYDNELRGALFKNKEKTEGDSKPDYTGNAVIDGTEYFMDAWLNVSKTTGKKYMAVKFKPKQASRNPPSREPVKQTREQQRAHSQGFDSYDDEIPF